MGMNRQLQMFNLRFCNGVSRLEKNVVKIEYKLKEKGKMVLAGPKEIGTLRHVKIVTLSCCLGALRDDIHKKKIILNGHCPFGGGGVDPCPVDLVPFFTK